MAWLPRTLGQEARFLATRHHEIQPDVWITAVRAGQARCEARKWKGAATGANQRFHVEVSPIAAGVYFGDSAVISSRAPHTDAPAGTKRLSQSPDSGHENE